MLFFELKLFIETDGDMKILNSNSIMNKIYILKYTIKAICVLLALVLVGTWLYRYNLDEDSTVIEERSYFDNEEDVFPVMCS